MAKRQKDPSKVAQKWSQNLSAAGERMADGIKAVTENPAQLAKAKKATMKARLMEALKDGGKYDQSMDRVTTAAWQQAALSKGVSRATQAASDPAVVSKNQAFMSQLLPYTAQVSATVAQMPNATKEDRKARMLKAFDMMSNFKRQG